MNLSQLEFRTRFTLDEKRAIYAAAASVVDIRIFLDELAAVDPAVGVDTTDPRTVAGVQALEVAGLIAPGRALEILGNDAPPEPETEVIGDPVGGYALGDRVRLLAPFGAIYPGEHEIVNFGPSSVRLAIGEFDLQFVEAT